MNPKPTMYLKRSHIDASGTHGRIYPTEGRDWVMTLESLPGGELLPAGTYDMRPVIVSAPDGGIAHGYELWSGGSCVAKVRVGPGPGTPGVILAGHGAWGPDPEFVWRYAYQTFTNLIREAPTGATLVIQDI